MSETRGRGPLWAGPEREEAAVAVESKEAVIARSTQATVNVLELRTYAEGCAIEVEASASTGDADPGEVLRSGMSPADGNAPGPPPAVLLFGVRLSDGRSASATEHPIVPSSEPSQPYFAVLGGPGFTFNGNQLRTRQTLWVWPIPSEPFNLLVEWPLFDIPETTVQLTAPVSR